jgi:hypothetical protein
MQRRIATNRMRLQGARRQALRVSCDVLSIKFDNFCRTLAAHQHCPGFKRGTDFLTDHKSGLRHGINASGRNFSQTNVNHIIRFHGQHHRRIPGVKKHLAAPDSEMLHVPNSVARQRFGLNRLLSTKTQSCLKELLHRCSVGLPTCATTADRACHELPPSAKDWRDRFLCSRAFDSGTAMTDLFSAMFVAALCAVLLVTGQHHLSKTPELATVISVPGPQAAAGRSSPSM